MDQVNIVGGVHAFSQGECRGVGGVGEVLAVQRGRGEKGGEFASFSPEYLFVGLHLNSPSITINLGLSINLKQVPYICQDTIHALSIDE